jgi:hypothetical protein
MLSTQSNPIFGVEMRQPDEVGLRRAGLGFDLRTFECAKCNAGTTFLVAI